MTRVIWGNVGERFFETGVDRGVLFVGDASGVPWTGLISVDESPTGGSSRGVYVDGIKYRNILSREEYEATIEAYTYPKEFGVCDGSVSVRNGLFATRQRRRPFGLTYRTLVGNDVHGTAHAYKIHIVYEASAEPTTYSHKSINDSSDISNFSWKITTRPPILSGYRPTSHFVIDSRETPSGLLSFIEDLLYGTEQTQPRLPSVGELAYLFTVFENPEYDAGSPLEPAYYTYDGGPAVANQTDSIDGGTP